MTAQAENLIGDENRQAGSLTNGTPPMRRMIRISMMLSLTAGLLAFVLYADYRCLASTGGSGCGGSGSGGGAIAGCPCSQGQTADCLDCVGGVWVVDDTKTPQNNPCKYCNNGPQNVANGTTVTGGGCCGGKFISVPLVACTPNNPSAPPVTVTYGPVPHEEIQYCWSCQPNALRYVVNYRETHKREYKLDGDIFEEEGNGCGSNLSAIYVAPSHSISVSVDLSELGIPVSVGYAYTWAGMNTDLFNKQGIECKYWRGLWQELKARDGIIADLRRYRRYRQSTGDPTIFVLEFDTTRNAVEDWTSWHKRGFSSTACTYNCF